MSECKESEEMTVSKESDAPSTDTPSDYVETKSQEHDAKAPPTEAQTTNNNSTEDITKVPDDLKEIVNALTFKDWDDNELKAQSIRFLEEDRLQRYGAKSESVRTAKHVLAVECVPDEDSDDDSDGDDDDAESEVSECIVAIDGEGKGSVVQMDDKIMMEEVSPSSLIEYTFDTANAQWMVAPMGLMSLEGYRRSKFANWKKMIEHPVCEAAFKRLLNVGIITNMFDHVAFPSPEHEEKEWIVKDEHDRDVVIPRPVQALRVWNVKKRAYEAVRAHLDGAPKAEEAAAYWEAMVAKFKEERGEEYIDGLLAAFSKKGGSEATEKGAKVEK